MAAGFGFARVTEELIRRGGLLTDGKPDSQKIDRAFGAAVDGGNPAVLQAIWNAAGEGHRPSLVVEQEARAERGIKSQVPVVMLLSPYRMRASATYLPTVEWLAAKGCDLKGKDADGSTLLHLAAEMDDRPLVDYLLANGFDADLRDKEGNSALGSTHDEDIALALLRAGADASALETKDWSLRRYANGQRWFRVLKWMENHPEHRMPGGQG
jgi:ankyrin repeat protein